MAKKVTKKTEEIVVQDVQTNEVENNETTNTIVEEVLQKIEEKIQEEQPKEVELKETVLDEDIQAIADDFKDTSARLENITKNNEEDIKTALEKELRNVEKAEEAVAKALAEAEKKVSTSDRARFSAIRDFGSWWNGSNSGL